MEACVELVKCEKECGRECEAMNIMDYEVGLCFIKCVEDKCRELLSLCSDFLSKTHT